MALKLFLCLTSSLSISSVEAGFNVDRPNITSVPVGGETSQKDILEIAERQGSPYPPINVPIPPNDLARLKNHRAFKDKTDGEIHSKVVNIRKAVLCAIDLLSRTDPVTAEGLMTNFRAGMICIGLAPENYNVAAAIQNDGREAFRLEPINIYKIPCEPLNLWSPELFELTNTLAHEGLHGRQNVLAWGTADQVIVAKDRQCKEIDASQGELERANEMSRIIEYIAVHGELPSDARGLYARMGASLLRNFAGNNVGLQGAISNWRQMLQRIIAISSEVKTFREAFKNAADLAINGSPDREEVLIGLRQHRLFQDYGNKGDFSPITNWYSSIAPRVITTPQGNSRVEGNNEMKQLYPLQDKPVTFAVNPLDSICTGYIAEDRNLAMIGGIKFGSGPEGQNEGVVVGFDIEPGTGRIIETTELVLLRTTEMGGGYIMNFNPHDGKFYAVQLDTNNVCLLDDTNNDGEPDLPVPIGTLGRGPDDLDIGGFGFTDANTIFAEPFTPGTCSHLSDPIKVCSREPGGLFSPEPTEEFRDTLTRRPGFDGVIFEGTQQPPIAGTPGGLFQVFKGDVLIADGCFSPNGFAAPLLDEPLGPGDELIIVDTLNGFSSVPTSPRPESTSRFSLELAVEPEIEGGGIFETRVIIQHAPDQQPRLRRGTSVDAIDDQVPLDYIPGPLQTNTIYSVDPTELNPQFFDGEANLPPIQSSYLMK